MAGFTWTSQKAKMEAIGFLARPGVIESISAQVQHKYIERFKERFAGRYTSEYPYDVGDNKFGYQYRIDISHAEGCPDELLTHISGKYKLRLENNDFIRDLVDNYGFIFTNGAQDSAKIFKTVSLIGGDDFEWFKSTFYVNERFIASLITKIKSTDFAFQVIDSTETPKKIKRNSKNKAAGKASHSEFSDEQLLTLGWIGEACVYQALINKDCDLISKLSLAETDDYVVEWYNNGFAFTESWEDNSVGKGCDIEVRNGKRSIFIEVKSSKRKSGIFTMTTNELVKMKQELENYYIVKVDNLEKILKNEPVDMQVFDLPYDKFFKPEKMKEATFRMESEMDE